ncbi:hypothetical protein JW935_25005 [candidate division KSB1 bacterium]|nr:hypothetical protein [candidate division KSB1 bacterium]
MYFSVFAIVLPRRMQRFLSNIALGVLCSFASPGFAWSSGTGATPQAGVLTPLLTPGTSRLVQQLEALLYDDDFCVMRNMLWKNIIIEAQKPGEITCARDWIMENVALLIPSDDSFKLDQVENVQLPVLFRIVPRSEGPANPAEMGHILGH